MSYKKVKSYKMTESELRIIWKNEYCDSNRPIYTFDKILVKFYEDMFDHAFYESRNRLKRDKSILSLNRCEKILWIKDTLIDPDAILKRGWNRKLKSYESRKRVALVKGNYVVIIRMIKEKQAKFVTAFEVNDQDNLNKILSGPDWEE